VVKCTQSHFATLPAPGPWAKEVESTGEQRQCAVCRYRLSATYGV
jgi:hypothetical protein